MKTIIGLFSAAMTVFLHIRVGVKKTSDSWMHTHFFEKFHEIHFEKSHVCMYILL